MKVDNCDKCACKIDSSCYKKRISKCPPSILLVGVVIASLSCFVVQCNAKKDDNLDCPPASEPPLITATKSNSLDKRGTLLNGAFASQESMEVESATSADETWDSFRPMFIFCKASYPITWDFSGSKPPDLSEETHVYVDSVLNPTKRCFVSSLKLLASGYTGKESRTGNYTCKSFDGKKAVSIYRFAHGE